MANAVICVDLSHYQRGFNFQEFKDGGGLGVILKASEGSFRDPDYSTFWDQAGCESRGRLLSFPSAWGHDRPSQILP